jgi:hypothetical protein
MIRMYLTGPGIEGRLPYRIDTEGTRLAVPYEGLASDPLIDACDYLAKNNAADLDAVVQLYNSPTKHGDQWERRTQVGYGVKVAAGEPINVVPPAIPAGDIPPPSRSPEPQADMDWGPRVLAKPGSRHRKRLRAGSGGRQGRR